MVFDESVTGFEAADVTLSGTAGTSTPHVTGSGTTYNVAVPVTSSWNRDRVPSEPIRRTMPRETGNTASTSTDHSVT